MAHDETVRETFRRSPDAEYFRAKERQGYELVAIEWRRPASAPRIERDDRLRQEVPYGLEVDADGHHLVEQAAEMEVMTVMLEEIVADRPLSAVAQAVNERGFRRRDGRRFTQVSVFNLLPRLVEVAPRIYSTQEWSKKSRHLHRLVS